MDSPDIESSTSIDNDAKHLIGSQSDRPLDSSSREIPPASSSELTKKILDQLGTIQESIRHKNKLIDNLKIIQGEIQFILSETDKLTNSDKPLTFDELNSLSQIYALVQDIFYLVDKNKSDRIDDDITKMMSNLNSIRSKVVSINLVRDKGDSSSAPASSSASAPASSSATPTPSAPATPTPAAPATTPAAATPQAKGQPLTSSNISQMSFTVDNKTIQLEKAVVDFVKNFNTYNGLVDKDNDTLNFETSLPSELDTILTTSTINGFEIKGNIKYKLQLRNPPSTIYQLRKNIFEYNGIKYYIFTKPGYAKKNNPALVLYIDGGVIKYFIYVPTPGNNQINLYIPVGNSGDYVVLDTVPPPSKLDKKKLNSLQLGGKKTRKKHKKIRNKKSNKVRFL